MLLTPPDNKRCFTSQAHVPSNSVAMAMSEGKMILICCLFIIITVIVIIIDMDKYINSIVVCLYRIGVNVVREW